MAGRILTEQVSQSVTAAASGTVTVASTTGFNRGAIAYLANAGQPGLTVKITQVVSATQLRIQEVQESRGGGVGSVAFQGGAAQQNAVQQTNYGSTTATAYIGGSITQPPHQIVYNPNDAPLT